MKIDYLHNFIRNSLITFGVSGFTLGLYTAPSHKIEDYYSNGVFRYVAEGESFLGDNLPISVLEGLILCAGAGLSYSLGKKFFKNHKKPDQKDLVEKPKDPKDLDSLVENNSANIKPTLKELPLRFLSTFFRYTRILTTELLILSVLGASNYNRIEFIEKAGLKEYNSNLNLDELVSRINEKKLKIGDWKFDKERFNEDITRSLDETYFLINGSEVKSPVKIKEPFFIPLRDVGIGGLTILSFDSLVDFSRRDFFSVWALAHEKAHTKGYLKERDAEALAYLACLRSNNDILKYCAYMHLFDLNLNNLAEKNPDEAERLFKQLNKESQEEFSLLSEDLSHENPAKTIVGGSFNLILKIRSQKSSVESYLDGPLQDLSKIDLAYKQDKFR
ncbi:DUF3810 family protein [Candidatus Woesearchaeota archaeon]|nr:DUF3810 family protein [Candidatus Woesearchaeota archaeon]